MRANQTRASARRLTLLGLQPQRGPCHSLVRPLYEYPVTPGGFEGASRCWFT